MLRDIFVFACIVAGALLALPGAFNGLLFYFWNAYFRPEQWTWNPYVAQLNLSFVIGAYVVLRTIVSPGAFRANLRTGLLVLFAGHTLMSALWSESPAHSWAAWLEFSKILLITYLIVALVDSPKRMRLALLTVACSLGFEVVKEGWVELLLHPGAQNNNWIPFLGDNNGVALGTMMLVPIFGALAKTATSKLEANFHRFCLVGAFLRGISTYSRGGFLAGMALALVALVQSKHRVRALISVAVLAALVFVAMPQRFWDRMQTITASDDQRDESQLGRLHFWHVAVAMAEAKPITGVGFDGYQSSYGHYNDVEDFGEERAVHSVWFGLLAELGYPGLFLFVAQLLLGFWGCLRVHAAARRDPSLQHAGYYADALGASLLAFTVAGTFLASQYNEMYWHLIGFTAALQLIAKPALATESAPVVVQRPQPAAHPALAR